MKENLSLSCFTVSPENSLVEKQIAKKATPLGHSIMEKNTIPGITSKVEL